MKQEIFERANSADVHALQASLTQSSVLMDSLQQQLARRAAMLPSVRPAVTAASHAAVRRTQSLRPPTAPLAPIAMRRPSAPAPVIAPIVQDVPSAARASLDVSAPMATQAQLATPRPPAAGPRGTPSRPSARTRSQWGALFVICVASVSSIGMVVNRLDHSTDRSGRAVALNATTFTGTIKPASETTIAAPLGATVRSVLVAVGESVVAGQPLIAIDDRTARETLAAATLELEGATQEVARLTRSIALIDRSLAGSAGDLSQATGRVAIAQRSAEQVPMRQGRDSTGRAEASLDQAKAKLVRAHRLQEAGLLSKQELEDTDIAVRIAEDDLENARRWRVAAEELQRAQEEQARVQVHRTRAEYRQQRDEHVALLDQHRR